MTIELLGRVLSYTLFYATIAWLPLRGFAAAATYLSRRRPFSCNARRAST